MARLTVLTAIYGGHDSLKDPEPQDAEFVCVTDDPDLTSETWKIIHEPRPDLSPRLAAKIPKFLPHLFVPAPLTVWVDASFRITSPDFSEAMAGTLRHGGVWAMFRHPWRDCIFDEADASVPLLKYAGQPIREQVECYRQAGHTAHSGLWACGVIVRRLLEKCVMVGQQWWEECERWTVQDQLSFPVVSRRLALGPTVIPGDIFQTPWLRWEGHLGGDR